MAYKVTDKDKGWKKWMKALRFLGGKQSSFEVGLLEGDASPEVIERGAINEVGFGPIPARPWLTTTLDKNSQKYLKQLSKDYVDEMQKGMPGGDARIKARLGEVVVNDLKKAIKTWSSPPNKASTVKKKGFNDPLRETGELMNAPTYRVTKPGEQNG